MKLIFPNPLDVSEQNNILAPYLSHCKTVVDSHDFTSQEASLCLPSDENTLSQVEEMVKKKKTPELKYVIVIGIGGSNLGAKAIYDALGGKVKMFFLDTIDPKANNIFLEFVNTQIKSENEFIISLISKSGTNTEPLVNAEILLGHLKNRFSKWSERCVIITDSDSPLWNEGKKLGIDVLGIPKKVGGRYSIFSAVGLFPLAMAGIDIQSLLKGAQNIRDICVTNMSDNYARSSSIFQYSFLHEGKAIHNSFFFHPELESLGKWYRQLMGESIGKEGKGITPIVSVGSVDHHSMVQLYWGGPSDKTTEIVYSQKSQNCIIPNEPVFSSLNAIAKGKNTSEIMTAIRKGTIAAYKTQQQPYFEVELEEINEYELGAFIQYKMMEILYLAHLMKIDAFNQPQVELYKTETRKILGQK